MTTPADFALINDLRKQFATKKAAESGGGTAAKRKLAFLEAVEMAASVSGSANDDDAAAFTSEGDIPSPRKKVKADYEERMASVARGREGRETFGSLKGKRKRRQAARRIDNRHATGRS
jgi:protein SDA1